MKLFALLVLAVALLAMIAASVHIATPLLPDAAPSEAPSSQLPSSATQ